MVRKQKTNNFSKILSRKFKWKLFQISVFGDWRPGYSRGPYWSRLAINAQSKADQFMQCLSNSPDDILRKLIYSKAHSKPLRWTHPDMNAYEHPTLFVNSVYNRFQKPHFQALKIDDMTIYRPGKDGAKHHVLGENAVDCLDSLVRDLDNDPMIFVLEKTQAQ